MPSVYHSSNFQGHLFQLQECAAVGFYPVPSPYTYVKATRQNIWLSSFIACFGLENVRTLALFSRSVQKRLNKQRYKKLLT